MRREAPGPPLAREAGAGEGEAAVGAGGRLRYRQRGEGARVPAVELRQSSRAREAAWPRAEAERHKARYQSRSAMFRPVRRVAREGSAQELRQFLRRGPVPPISFICTAGGGGGGWC